MKKLLLIIFCLALIKPSLLQAQTPTADLNLTIFPPTAYIMVKPGQTLTHRVILNYQGTVPITITPQLVDFITDGLTGSPILQQPSKIKWITIQNIDKDLNRPFTITPHSQVELVLEIAPPTNIVTAETPLSLLLQANPTTQPIFDGSLAQTTGAIASNVIVSVQQDLDNLGKLEVEKLKLPRFIDSFRALNFEILAKNSGRNAVAASGQVTLTHNWSHKLLKTWYIYPDTILANSTRQLRLTNADPTTLKNETEFEFTSSRYKPLFLIGPFQITINLSDARPNNSHQTTYTQRIIAFPFSLLIALMLGISIYLLTMSWQKKHSIFKKI